MTLRKLMLTSVTAAAMSAPMLATAESDLAFGAAGATTATVNLDFQIVIPSFIFFQVGAFGAGNIDLVDFNLQTAAETPGSGTGVGRTNGGGVPVVLSTNATNVRVAASGAGVALTETGGGADVIPLAEITGVSTGGGAIPVPDFGTDTGLAVAGGIGVTDTWTFTYDNINVYAAGTYGSSTNNGRVIYTAADF